MLVRSGTVATRGATIAFAVRGATAGIPVLLIAPGGMRSSIGMWRAQPWDAWSRLGDEDFTVVAMDQRNAGDSSGPVDAAAGWDAFAEDQIAVLDHLGIGRCLLIGQCIGPSYIFRLLRHSPERFSGALMLQPIGVAEHTTEAGGWEGTNAASTRDWFGAWAQEMCSAGRATDAELQRLHGAMFESGTEKFVFSASREEVSAVQTPLLVTAGHGRKDIYHPAEVAREVARLAPNSELLERWRDGDFSEAVAARFIAFLRRHAPPPETRWASLEP
ncbi:hypothetical protein EMIHUDRAFT_232548 [Emiliania huxleyi CCMP1516]|uniref:AB hydrolase-1 domain-containing protein n=2 Tax=Emiliania huxleyi TaxID=2903 RepID=A0A0D3K4P8_EMIH1|nr:hypothetical protein EMIHUDRAFT_232548 [Emiliania huxleyi CCMP1516]EOD30733.1 hypothetical protein EMIHUDRAFT_232548 [Emiliania huxleyi CCMP1516]|eukprot:XP_005783162.1 hypothetical protein EMIHUDRAFT_232548 [Emiliania huxleyi CCMP1516]